MSRGLRELTGFNVARVAAPAQVGTAAVLGLVAPARRERERLVQFANAPEHVREIAHLVCNDVGDPTLMLHLSLATHHAGREHEPALAFEQRGHTIRLAMPVSSSSVMNMTPFAEPGI